LEIVTEDNISGISEIPGTSDIDAALAASRDLLIGKDVFQLNEIKQVLVNQFGVDNIADRGEAPWDQRKLVHIFSAVEVACMDIIGKVTNRPIVDLLGGKMRDRVPFSAYLFYKYEGAGGTFGFNTDPAASGWSAARQQAALTPAQIVAQAQAMCKEFGFQSIKLKGGVFEPRQEVDAIIALRDAFGPSVPLRIDPNALWEVDTAIQFGREMEPILEYLEDPVRGQQNMALVRKALKTPLATNMCTTSFEDIPQSIILGSEDIILSDHHFWGGLRSSITLSGICATFSRGLSMHSNSHLGISLAAMVHLGAALPEMPYALDTHYPWQSDEIIIGGQPVTLPRRANRLGPAPAYPNAHGPPRRTLVQILRPAHRPVERPKHGHGCGLATAPSVCRRARVQNPHRVGPKHDAEATLSNAPVRWRWTLKICVLPAC
jgi:glucarate dehydratase